MDRCPTSCQIEQLALGELAPEFVHELEAHVARCAACRATLERLREEYVQTRQVLLSPRPETPRPAARHPVPLRTPWTTPVPADDGHLTHQTRADPERFSSDSTETEPDPEDLRQLAHYRIVRPIGRGGMGVVYWAEDTHLQRPVAIKVLRQRSANDPELRQRFLREARAMAALKHDHIAVIYQVSESAAGGAEGLPFLAMELLDGENLDAWMRGNPHPPIPWIARIGRQAAEGLAAAHACGLLHRDVKPANLWLEAPAGWLQTPAAARPPLGAVGRIKLLDFGLAQPTADGPDDDDHVMGTPAYMAPEQARGAPLDPRCDLFGLGCVLYQMCTGRHPFPVRHRGDPLGWPPHVPPKPVRELNPSVPPRLAGLIERMVAEKADDRPDSARQVAQELAAIERGHGDPRTDTDAWPPIPRPNLRRRRALALGALALFFVSGGGVVAWYWPHSPSASTLRAETTHPMPSEPAPPPPTTATTHSVVDPLTVPGPPDAAWRRRVRELPPTSQVPVVLAKLKELNPNFDGESERVRIGGGQVVELRFLTDEITDIRPVQALTGLKSLGCVGSVPGKGRLTDLSPLRELQLDWLFLWHNPDLKDVSPLRGMSLIQFEPSHTALANLDDLAPERLTVLNIQHTKVVDLRRVSEFPRLAALYGDGCAFESLEPLQGSSLKEVILDYRPARDEKILRGLKTLEKINRMSVGEFWRRHPRLPAEIPEPS